MTGTRSGRKQRPKFDAIVKAVKLFAGLSSNPRFECHNKAQEFTSRLRKTCLVPMCAS